MHRKYKKRNFAGKSISRLIYIIQVKFRVSQMLWAAVHLSSSSSYIVAMFFYCSSKLTISLRSLIDQLLRYFCLSALNQDDFLIKIKFFNSHQVIFLFCRSLNKRTTKHVVFAPVSIQHPSRRPTESQAT